MDFTILYDKNHNDELKFKQFESLKMFKLSLKQCSQSIHKCSKISKESMLTNVQQQLTNVEHTVKLLNKYYKHI